MLKRYKVGHFFDQNLKNNFIIILSGIVMILSGCLELEVVHQPPVVAQGATFDAEVIIEFRKHPDIGTDDNRAMLFAVNKPEAWIINEIYYSSPEYGEGIFNYLGNDADENEAAGIDFGWEDSLEQGFPSSADYHWQMYVSDRDETSTSSDADPDSFFVTVSYTIDNTLGEYNLHYYTTHTNNNDHTDGSKIAYISAGTTVLVSDIVNNFDADDDGNYWNDDQVFNINADPSYAYVNINHVTDNSWAGPGSVELQYSVHNAEGWGGFTRIGHRHPDLNGLYDWSEFDTLSFAYYINESASIPERVHVRFNLLDHGALLDGQSLDDQLLGEVFYSFHYILDEDPTAGWNHIKIPLVNNYSWDGDGFNLTGWQGSNHNGELDLNAIGGFHIEFSISGAGEGDYAGGTILLDEITLIEAEATPVDITFNLDLTIQPVSDNGVHIAGSFNGWDPAGTEMVDEDGDGVYSYTTGLFPGETIYYLFINGNSWGNNEIVFDTICGGAGGFSQDRFLVVPEQSQALDPVCLNLCSSCEDAQAVYFYKPEYEDWNNPEYQDYIMDNVIITRGNNKPIFNYAVESWENLEGGCEIPYPSGTEWSPNSTNLSSTYDYTTFINMSGCTPPNIVGNRTSMRIPGGGENGEDLYFDVHWYEWGSGNSGGAVQYMRWPSEPPYTDSQGGLFFSEYGEGSSNNKYLEIYNGTGSDVDLTGLAFPNVGNSPTYEGEYEYWNNFPDGAVLAPGDVYVISHPEADDAILAHADYTFQYLSNGDDGYCLVEGTELDFSVLDCIGDWNGDPGDGWDVAGVEAGTMDHTLVRKNYVEEGNGGDWYMSAGTDPVNSEWIVLEQNNWTFLGSHPHQPFSCDENIDGFNYIGSMDNSCYYISDPENPMVWTDASEMAQAHGGHLATVTSQEEQDVLGGSGGWIGLTDENIEGQWEWVTGEPVDYTYWFGGEPNDAGNGEDYVERYPDGWNDHQSDHMMPFFMEISGGSDISGVEETLSYGNDDPDSWGGFSQYTGDAMLMAYRVPADGYITDLNIPVSDGDPNMVASVSLHRLSYPYNEFGENYSDDIVDSDGWIGGYDMDSEGNLNIEGSEYTFGGTPTPCSDMTVNDGARDPLSTDSYEISSYDGTVQTGLIWQTGTIDGWNIGSTENIFNTGDWGDQPMVYKDEWIGILVEMVEGDWMSFYSTYDHFDSYPFLKFYGNGTCNGTSGNGGWHIRSAIMKWDVGMLLTGDRAPMVHDFQILNTGTDTGDRHVWADITDDNPSGGESGVAYAELVYSSSLDDDETWHSVNMENTSDNHYEAHVPGYPPGTDVWYYIYAEDNNGHWTESATVSYTVYEQVRPHLFIYNTDEYDDWIMDFYLFNSSSSQDFDFWSGPYYGDVNHEILEGYDLIVEVSGTQGPWVMTQDHIRDWLSADGDRSYIIAGADYLWWMTDGSEDELPEGSFLRDVLGVRQPVHDIVYWNGGYGEAISRMVPSGHGISGDLASFISDSLVLNYDPDYELGEPNWIDGIIRADDSEPASFSGYSGPVDNNGNISDDADFFDMSSYVELENGSRALLLAFDPLATNTSYVGSDPYNHSDGYYWTGVMSIGPLQSAIDEMLNLNMTFGIDHTTGLPGETVSVSVWAEVPEDLPMYSYEISVIGFGGDMINYVSVDTIGSMTPSDWIFSYSSDDENGVVITAGAGSQGVTGSGNLFNLSFSISPDMDGGNFIDLFLTDPLINENTDIGYDIENGGVLVLTYGDVSTNGDVTPFDASLILQYLAGSIELDEAQIGVGDVTQDATLSALDAAKILDYSVGLIESLPVGNDDVELAQGFIDISGGSYTPGDIISMPITLESGDNVRSFEVDLSYDPEVLAFNSVEWGDDIGAMTIMDLQEEGVFRASAAGIGSLNSGSITLGTIQFELLDSFADQQTMVTMSRSRLNEEAVLVDEVSAVFTNALLVVDEWGHGGVPEVFALKQNYPNPFNPTTRIRYQLPQEAMVSVRVYDIMGRVVSDLVPRQKKLAGFYQATWNATNNSGDQVGAGMYIYVIEADNFRDSHKMVLMK